MHGLSAIEQAHEQHVFFACTTLSDFSPRRSSEAPGGPGAELRRGAEGQSPAAAAQRPRPGVLAPRKSAERRSKGEGYACRHAECLLRTCRGISRMWMQSVCSCRPFRPTPFAGSTNNGCTQKVVGSNKLTGSQVSLVSHVLGHRVNDQSAWNGLSRSWFHMLCG